MTNANSPFDPRFDPRFDPQSSGTQPGARSDPQSGTRPIPRRRYEQGTLPDPDETQVGTWRAQPQIRPWTQPQTQQPSQLQPQPWRANSRPALQRLQQAPDSDPQGTRPLLQGAQRAQNGPSAGDPADTDPGETRSLRRYWRRDPDDTQAVAQAEAEQTRLLHLQDAQGPYDFPAGEPQPPTGTRPLSQGAYPSRDSRLSLSSPTPSAPTGRQLSSGPYEAYADRNGNSGVTQPAPQRTRFPSPDDSENRPPVMYGTQEGAPGPAQMPTEPGSPFGPAPMPAPVPGSAPGPDGSNPSEPAPMPVRTRGSGLVWTLAVGLGLVGAHAPFWALLLGLALLWGFTARGRAVIAEHRRMYERGGFRLRSDRTKMALSTPWYLLASIPRVLVAFLVWLPLAVGVDLLFTLGFGFPYASGTFRAFGWVITYPLLSGAAVSGSALVWGLLTAGWWLIVALTGSAYSPRSAGFQSGQASIRKGWDRVRGRGGSATGIVLTVCLALLLLVGAGSLGIGGTTDWTPLELTNAEIGSQELPFSATRVPES